MRGISVALIIEISWLKYELHLQIDKSQDLNGLNERKAVNWTVNNTERTIWKMSKNIRFGFGAYEQPKYLD